MEPARLFTRLIPDLMKTSQRLLPSLALASLLAGCVGTGPNTQQGVIGGAALGALTGAIIGNNSGSHNGASGAAIGALAGGIAGGTLGISLDHQRGTLYTSESQATTQVVVTQPPPAPPLNPHPRTQREDEDHETHSSIRNSCGDGSGLRAVWPACACRG